eukprot:Nk52_evm6s2085 gene=Nk52_evmTU6s2085
MASIVDFEEFKTDFTIEEVLNWFKNKLKRSPELYDIYNTAKEYYSLGAFVRAKLCLELYTSINGALLPGFHLLGYCYLHLNELEPSLINFLKCIKEGYDEDWQLIVELYYELGAQMAERGEQGSNNASRAGTVSRSTGDYDISLQQVIGNYHMDQQKRASTAVEGSQGDRSGTSSAQQKPKPVTAPGAPRGVGEALGSDANAPSMEDSNGDEAKSGGEDHINEEANEGNDADAPPPEQ